MRVRQSGYAWQTAAVLLAWAQTAVVAVAATFQGLPPTRAYSLEDIGYVARGANLDFDRFGRLAAIQEGIYAVLNDTVWINLADTEVNRRHVMVSATQGADGRTYYGARETWGLVEVGTDGRLRTVSLAPPDVPKWIQTASFNEIVSTRAGVYFVSWNGVVFLDFATRRNQFFAVGGVAGAFAIDERVYVSSISDAVQFVDISRGEVVPVVRSTGSPIVIEYGTSHGRDRALVAEAEGRMWTFDGRALSPWDGLTRIGVSGRISALQGLVDGGVAIAVVGQGVFLFGEDGELQTALNLTQYHRITDMANREPGVLWVATEDTIEKVLYGSPISSIGQKVGLTVSWPLVERWDDRLFIATEGKLFEAIPSGPGRPSRFEETPTQPPGGAWSMAAHNGRMLVGSAEGIFTMEPDGRFERVADIRDLSHLVMVGEDLCYAIGTAEIAVLRWRDGSWSEAAPRAPGLVYTPIVHATERSVWVEMGGGGVARVRLEDGAIRVDVVENDSWTNATWVNIGVIDDIVILSAARGKRRFFDEQSGDWCQAPALEALLDRPSEWVARARKDGRGVIWASHNEGVITFTPRDGDYVVDTFSFDQINDRYPTVHILPGDDVWIAAGQALHHVEPRRGAPTWVALRPTLVSIFDTGTNTELLRSGLPDAGPLVLPYAQNDLSFRLFAGGYGWRRAPVYEFRLGEGQEWTTHDSGSLLSFNGLREGAYRLQVRIAGSQAQARPVASLAFEIRPPWHRTPYAFVGYVVLLGGAVLAVAWWSGHLVRKRNRLLEGLVRERTSQLESTMEKLNDETRNAATLAERNRLAGEIHDSLQQGLSGAILQLDSTLKLGSVPGEIRSRLNVVRNMVSYTRQEVQHAVWDMESPLSEGVDLGEALRRLAGFINSCPAAIDVEVEGEPCALPRAAKHNLLRIAQEATTNAVRHAAASRIHVHLLYAAEAVTLSVTDDGVGFDPGAAMDGNVGHFGLRGIRSRAKKLQGQLTIQSSPGAGATIRVVLPRPVHEEDKS
ncbi:MAG: ATP-binding protein [Opitutaceae bacterium]|nr:ATP-binding protein [Opitutaceae bacterium]